MGKNKTANKNDPESLKEAGNKAFARREFTEAINFYTKAIALKADNHVYFANRANAHLELGHMNECIADCEAALKIEPSFAKAFFRKAKANLYLDNVEEAKKVAESGLAKDKESDMLKELLLEIESQLAQDKSLPKDHPARKSFEEYKKWAVESQGVLLTKNNVRFENENFKVAVASQNVAKGEDVIQVPSTAWITMEVVQQDNATVDAILKAMKTEDQGKLSFPWRVPIFSVFLAQERAKPSEKYATFLKSFPTDASYFPVLFSEKQMEAIKGSQLTQIVNIRRQAIANNYQFLCTIHPDLKSKVTLEQYTEAYVLINSRAKDMKYTDGTIRQVLIPYIEVSPVSYSQEENVSLVG